MLYAPLKKESYRQASAHPKLRMDLGSCGLACLQLSSVEGVLNASCDGPIASARNEAEQVTLDMQTIYALYIVS